MSLLMNLLPALFVIAIALLYSVTGTLNMAHLAERVAELEQTGILNVIAILFYDCFWHERGAISTLLLAAVSPFGLPVGIACLIWWVANKGWDLRS